MADKNTIELTCNKCGHIWRVDLSALEKKDQVIYRNAKKRQTKDYRVRCPRCHHIQVITVAFEED